MSNTKQNIFIVIIIILLILLVASIFIIFRNNNVERDEVNPELTNQMSDSLETNVVNENTTVENTTIDNQTTNSVDKVSTSVEVSKEERTKIEQYIDVICNRPQISRLKEFTNIAKADKEWIYLHIDREKYEQYATEQEILDNLQDIFGKELVIDIKSDQKSIPNDRFSGIPKVSNEGKYLLPTWGDSLVFLYAVNDIKKDNSRYVVNVIEYCEDLIDENPYARAVFAFKDNNSNKKIFDLKEEQSAKDSNVIDKVIQNKNEFTSYNVVLKNDNGKLIVESIKKN